MTSIYVYKRLRVRHLEPPKGSRNWASSTSAYISWYTWFHQSLGQRLEVLSCHKIRRRSKPKVSCNCCNHDDWFFESLCPSTAVLLIQSWQLSSKQVYKSRIYSPQTQNDQTRRYRGWGNIVRWFSVHVITAFILLLQLPFHFPLSWQGNAHYPNYLCNVSEYIPLSPSCPETLSTTNTKQIQRVVYWRINKIPRINLLSIPHTIIFKISPPIYIYLPLGNSFH